MKRLMRASLPPMSFPRICPRSTEKHSRILSATSKRGSLFSNSGYCPMYSTTGRPGVDLPTRNLIRKKQEENPLLGEFRMYTALKQLGLQCATTLGAPQAG